MYMEDIQLFAKNDRELKNSNTNCENIQSRYRNGICEEDSQTPR